MKFPYIMNDQYRSVDVERSRFKSPQNPIREDKNEHSRRIPLISIRDEHNISTCTSNEGEELPPMPARFLESKS